MMTAVEKELFFIFQVTRDKGIRLNHQVGQSRYNETFFSCNLKCSSGTHSHRMLDTPKTDEGHPLKIIATRTISTKILLLFWEVPNASVARTGGGLLGKEHFMLLCTSFVL